MKRFILIMAVIMMASPVMADIIITIDNSVYPAEVKYNRTDMDVARVRAFALDIKTDGATGVKDINDVNDVSTNYWVHPGGINIVGGEVEQDGNAWADPCAYDGTLGGIDTNGVTIEMASLFIGEGNAPPNQGVLCTLAVTSPCLVSITENTIRGGVVLEDTNLASDDGVLDLTGATNIAVGPITECYAGQPDYSEWEAAGKPDCWCYPRQCYGDADGNKEGSGIAGYAYVSPKDLSVLVGGWMIKDPTKGLGILGVTVTVDSVEVPVACADFDRAREGSGIAGYARVSPNDLAILVTSWMIKEPTKGLGIPSDCSPGNETP